MTRPDIAARPCEDCKRWVYATDTGELRKDRQGNPLPRPPGAKPPCGSCPKCENLTEQTPKEGRKSEMSQKNQRTLALYYALQASPEPVCDPITRGNLGVIHRIIAAHGRAQDRQIASSLELLRYGR